MSGERAADVAVVGGGVIGCAVAWELARRGLDVVVLERDQPGSGASTAAGGMLSPLGEAHRPGPFLELSLDALRAYPDWVDELTEATGIDVDYRTDGKLELAYDDAAVRALREQADWQREAGFAVEWLEGDDVLGMVPGLRPPLGALHIPWDHRIDTDRLSRALWQAAARAGARTVAGAEVRAVARGTVAGGGEAVRGVELATGAAVEAPRVVVAAGAWSGALGGLPATLPVRPVRGEIVVVQTTPPILERTVAGLGRYMIPRSDGRLLIGATEEDAGFRDGLTAGGAHALLDAALRMLPALARAPIVDGWAGLRPGTPDDLPIIGPDPRLEGLFYATGHYRNGILLAPVTARLLADLITDERAEAPGPFAPTRFETP